MKKWIILSSVLLVSLIVVGYLVMSNPKEVSAKFSHSAKFISSVEESEGVYLETYDFSVSITENTKINYVTGKLILKNYEVVDFQFLGNPKESSFNPSTLEYSIKYNHAYSATEGVLTYARVKVRTKASKKDCEFSYEPAITGYINTNSFEITKKAYQGSSEISKVNAGDEFTYKIVVKGIDNKLDTDNVVVTDLIPSHLEIVSSDGSVSGQNITWNLGSFPVGDETRELYVNVRAKADYGGDVSNTAILTVDDKTLNADASVKVVKSNITIKKTASKSSVNMGERFYYTIVVSNTGDGDSKDVVVEDILDSKLEYLSSSVTPTISSGKYKFNLGVIKAGESKTITLNVKASSSGDEIVNTATATETGKDPVSSSVNVTILQPDLRITKNVSKTNVKIGESFTYTIKIENNGLGKANGVLVTDQIPSSLQIISVTGASYIDNLVSIEYAYINPNETKTITVVVRAKNDASLGILNNSVKADCANYPEISANVDVNIEDSDLTVTKSASKSILKPGEEFTYTISLTNKGADTNSFVVEDIVDSNLKIVSAPGALVNGHKLTWNYETLEAGKSTSIEFKVKVLDNVLNNQVIPNTVVVRETGKEEISGEVSVTVKRPVLNITKEANIKVVKPDEEFIYTINVTNSGEVSSGKIELKDELDKNLVLVDAEDGQINGNVITWNIDSVATGASKTIRLRVKALNNLPNNTLIDNTVKLKHNNEEQEATETVTVVNSDVYIMKKADKDIVVSGDTLKFDLTIVNRGNVDAADIKIVDSLPTKLMYVSSVMPSNVTLDNENKDIIYHVPVLNANSSIVISLTVKVSDKVKDGEIIKNTAVLHYQDKEVSSMDQVEAIDTNVVISKESSKENVTNDEEFYYLITVKNTGGLDATNLIVTDTLSEKIVVLDNDGGAQDNNVITWMIPELKANSSQTFKIKVKVVGASDNEKVKNVVVVSETGKEDKKDEVEVLVGEYKYSIIKSVSKDVINKNEEFKYFITIKNESGLSLENLVVEDILSDDLIVVDAGGGVQNNNKLSWSLNLNGNEEKKIEILVKLKKDSNTELINNIATLKYRDDVKDSNEVKVKVSVDNPQTGAIFKICTFIVLIVSGIFIFRYIKKQKFYKL